MGSGRATSQQRELFEDYEGFVEKFKPKKTTDDCYTPDEIYEVMAEIDSLPDPEADTSPLDAAKRKRGGC